MNKNEKYSNYKYKEKYINLKKQIGGTKKFTVFYNNNNITYRLDEDTLEGINTYQQVVDFYSQNMDIKKNSIDIINKFKNINRKSYSLLNTLIKDDDIIYLLPLSDPIASNFDTLKIATGFKVKTNSNEEVLGREEKIETYNNLLKEKIKEVVKKIDKKLEQDSCKSEIKNIIEQSILSDDELDNLYKNIPISKKQINIKKGKLLFTGYFNLDKTMSWGM